MALIETIKGSKLKPQSKQSHQEAYLNRTFAVLEVATEERVIKKKKIILAEQPKIYVFMEEIYDIVFKEHVSCGHGGRDRTFQACKR